MSGRWLFACIALSSGSFACGHENDLGQPTATACRDSSSLTYEADIAPIMLTYCVSCHAKSVPFASRHGAPTDHNFETQFGILKEAQHVDQEAGSNGTITNTNMPPGGYPAPNVEQRMKLSQWLACTAPENTVHKE